MVQRILLALILFAAFPARAAGTGAVGTGANLEYIGRKLVSATVADACQANAQALATSALDCAAFELDTLLYSKVWFVVEFTYVAATELQVYVDHGVAPSPPWGRMIAGDASSPPVVVFGEQQGQIPTGSASNVWTIGFNVFFPSTRWRWTSSGGTTDTITVTAFGIRR
jgi:hypothetical protein